MKGDLENPMFLDSQWRHLEKELKVVDYCQGCSEEIYEGQDIYEFAEGSVHNDSECCKQYIGSISLIKVAGEV